MEGIVQVDFMEGKSCNHNFENPLCSELCLSTFLPLACTEDVKCGKCGNEACIFLCGTFGSDKCDQSFINPAL